MSWYDEDFYDEPSEFDEKMEELKESIAKSVKSEVLEEMERLRAENKQLQEVKEKFEQIKREYDRKKHECEIAMREAEENAKQMRLKEMLDKYKLILWEPSAKLLYGPKCDKCDCDRYVEITLPSGRTANDYCECSRGSKTVMVPKRLVRHEIGERDGRMVAWYRECRSTDGYYYDLDRSFSIYAERALVKPGTPPDVLEASGKKEFLFQSEEECLAYCKYVNEKNRVTDDLIYERDGKVFKREAQ